MRVHTFIADSAEQAVEELRRRLGPQAVVLNVRKLPAGGFARLWQKPRIEVLATLPEPANSMAAPDALIELRQELADLKQRVSTRHARKSGAPADRLQDRQSKFGQAPSKAVRPRNGAKKKAAGRTQKVLPSVQETALAPSAPQPSAARNPATNPPSTLDGGTGTLLERSGLLPVFVGRVLGEMRAQSEDRRPASLADELANLRAVLLRLWPARQPPRSNTHIFVGPPGAGKTTCLIKWLAQAVLVDGRKARIWRLDGHAANTAEALSVHAEILGVPVERVRPEGGAVDPSELAFVDLPGITTENPAALKDLAWRLQDFPDAQVHLVLNAAYETPLLLGQGRAFAALPISDVILTHLDEEPRWGKLWSFVLGTNFTISFLSAGQNVPGDFQPADPETLLARHFPRN